MQIRAFTLPDIPQVKSFFDRTIGTNYYSVAELEKIYHQSIKNGRCYTLLLMDSARQIHGVRVTYPPGHWQKGKGPGLSPDQWGVPRGEVAYFQSLFIEPSLTGRGWGKKMSLAAIEMLKNSGARAIVTHSWKESPHDSSGKYLRALGFRLIAIHPFYWKEVDYTCPRCGQPCVCTAEEMILNL